MNDFYYLDVKLKLKNEESAAITAEYFHGCIIESLIDFFGELGGHIHLELLQFDATQIRGILKTLPKFYKQTCAAIAFISDYQNIPCYFEILKVSQSYCRTYGKDKVVFVTKEDHAKPSTIEIPPPEPAPGILTENGDINWGCPCLGGMTTGPCGVEFREAFSCFHYSEADPKGSDCFDAFRTMQECFTKYPTVYNKAVGDDVEEDNALDIPGMEEIKENNISNQDGKEYKSITTEVPPSQAIEKK